MYSSRGIDTDGGRHLIDRKGGVSIGLLQFRAAIQDPSVAGHQPISSPGGLVGLVSDGESCNDNPIAQDFHLKIGFMCKIT